jgi:hypothetical protein
MYRLDQDGTVYNRFRLQVANRGHAQATAVLSIEGLPGTHFAGFEPAVVINAGQSLQREFEIAAGPPMSLAPGVNHFRVVSKVGQEQDVFEETFITPTETSR